MHTTSGAAGIRAHANLDNPFLKHAHQTRANTTDNTNQKYTVQRIVFCIGSNNNVWYVVRCCAYNARYLTEEEAEQIALYLIVYNRRCQKNRFPNPRAQLSFKEQQPTYGIKYSMTHHGLAHFAGHIMVYHWRVQTLRRP